MARSKIALVGAGNIGGQPFVLTTWNDDVVVDEALNVVKW